MTHEEVVEALRSAALDEQHTGWLSDIPEAHYDEDHGTIAITEAGWPVGSIDLYQLASVVVDLLGSGED